MAEGRYLVSVGTTDVGFIVRSSGGRWTSYAIDQEGVLNTEPLVSEGTKTEALVSLCSTHSVAEGGSPISSTDYAVQKPKEVLCGITMIAILLICFHFVMRD